MGIDDALCIPYLLVVESVEDEHGEWTRRVGYPELGGCAVEDVNLADAVEELERTKVRILVEMLRSNATIPVPHPPLKERSVLLSSVEVEQIIAAEEAQPGGGKE
jgi:hypothetical protein